MYAKTHDNSLLIMQRKNLHYNMFYSLMDYRQFSVQLVKYKYPYYVFHNTLNKSKDKRVKLQHVIMQTCGIYHLFRSNLGISSKFCLV